MITHVKYENNCRYITFLLFSDDDITHSLVRATDFFPVLYSRTMRVVHQLRSLRKKRIQQQQQQQQQILRL